jgi:RHS repeat-associated protein
LDAFGTLGRSKDHSGYYQNFSYDAKGNALTRNGLSVTWASFNHPSLINGKSLYDGSSESVSFAYDQNHERWKAVLTSSAGTETTYLIGGLLEKVITAGAIDFRHFITAGGARIAVYSRTAAGVNTLRYIREDHLGSTASLLNSDGTSYVKESFTAFGLRRSSCTWTGNPTSGNLTKINSTTRRGYTEHTALGSMGLNDMNGRIQDAVTGRFLSADPYISEPGNTQNYNRYSYVLNNPLSYVDPSGMIHFHFCSDVYIAPTSLGAVGNDVVGVIGGHYASRCTDFDMDTGEGMPWWWGFPKPHNPGPGTTAPNDPEAPPTAPTEQTRGGSPLDTPASEWTAASLFGGVPTNTQSAAFDTSTLDEIVVQGARSGSFGGVGIDFRIPFPREQLWAIYSSGRIDYLGSTNGNARGNVGENRASAPRGFVAIVHTHPSWAEYKPGPADFGLAVPLYGIAPAGVWRITPGATSLTVLYGRRP